ncbi:unnamed protein product [Closterium sp. Naga37s-1]|nr:unnamed protein product [Closterium sp. Naga37s-1]
MSFAPPPPANSTCGGGDGGGAGGAGAAWGLQYLWNVSAPAGVCCVALFAAVKLRADHRLPSARHAWRKLRAVWHVTDAQIVTLCGADAADYLILLVRLRPPHSRCTCALIAALLVPAMALLFPANVRGADSAVCDYLAAATIAHVAPAAPALWLHALFALLLPPAMHLAIRAFRRQRVRARAAAQGREGGTGSAGGSGRAWGGGGSRDGESPREGYAALHCVARHGAAAAGASGADGADGDGDDDVDMTAHDVAEYTILIRGVPRGLSACPQLLLEYWDRLYPGRVARVLQPPDVAAALAARRRVAALSARLAQAHARAALQGTAGMETGAGAGPQAQVHGNGGSDVTSVHEPLIAWSGRQGPAGMQGMGGEMEEGEEEEGGRGGHGTGTDGPVASSLLACFRLFLPPHAARSAVHCLCLSPLTALHSLFLSLSHLLAPLGLLLPLTSPAWLWGMGVSDWGEEARRLEEQVRRAEGEAQLLRRGRGGGAGVALVVFRDAYTATRALRDALWASPRWRLAPLATASWRVERAPPAASIIWRNVGGSRAARRVRTWVVNVVVVVALCAWSCPLALLSAVSSAAHTADTAALSHLNAWLSWARSNSGKAAVVLQFLPNVLSFTAMYGVMPAALHRLVLFEGHITTSRQQAALLLKLTALYLFNLYVLKALLEALLQAALLHAQRCSLLSSHCPTVLHWLNASLIPASSLSALCFLLTSALLGVSFDLLAPLAWLAPRLHRLRLSLRLALQRLLLSVQRFSQHWRRIARAGSVGVGAGAGREGVGLGNVGSGLDVLGGWVREVVAGREQVGGVGVVQSGAYVPLPGDAVEDRCGDGDPETRGGQPLDDMAEGGNRASDDEEGGSEGESVCSSESDLGLLSLLEEAEAEAATHSHLLSPSSLTALLSPASPTTTHTPLPPPSTHPPPCTPLDAFPPAPGACIPDPTAAAAEPGGTGASPQPSASTPPTPEAPPPGVEAPVAGAGAQEPWRKRRGVLQFDYAQYYAYNTTALCLLLFHAPLAPLVLPAGLLFFSYRLIVDKYNYLFLYRARPHHHHSHHVAPHSTASHSSPAASLLPPSGPQLVSDGRLVRAAVGVLRMSVCATLAALAALLAFKGDPDRLQAVLLGSVSVVLSVMYGIEALVRVPGKARVVVGAHRHGGNHVLPERLVNRPTAYEVCWQQVLNEEQ